MRVNEIKIKKALRVPELELAGPAIVEKVTGAPVGFAGPVGLKDIQNIGRSGRQRPHAMW